DVHFEDIFTVESDLAFDTSVAQCFTNAVEAAEEGRLAASGGPDQSRDLIGGEFERNVMKRFEGAVIEVDAFCAQLGLGGDCCRSRCRSLDGHGGVGEIHLTSSGRMAARHNPSRCDVGGE